MLRRSYEVSVSLGEVYECTKKFSVVPLKIRKVEFSTEVYMMEIDDLDIILGMDWLKRDKVVINYDEQKVQLVGQQGKKITYRGPSLKTPKKPQVNVLITVRMRKLVNKGLLRFLGHVRQLDVAEPTPEEVTVVSEYLVVFSKEIPGMPPLKEVEFTIDLVPCT